MADTWARFPEETGEMRLLQGEALHNLSRRNVSVVDFSHLHLHLQGGDGYDTGDDFRLERRDCFQVNALHNLL